MRLLVWQWGRRGAGPRYAAGLAAALDAVPGTSAVLSLSCQAELMAGADPPACALPMPTYRGLGGLLARLPRLPFEVAPLARRLRGLGLDAALCAMPAPLDLLMQRALGRAGVPLWVVVHDADPHPGDGFPMQMRLQRALCRRAAGLVALSGHVRDRLEAQGFAPVVRSSLPPLVFGPVPPPPRAHGGRLRLLCFGRLLPYKGLDLLAAAWRTVDVGAVELRVVGQGPETAVLDGLRALPGVTVENRWVPEHEVAALLAWADALVLPYREASQSGAAAAALAAGRWVVATATGGLAEQLRGAPGARVCAADPARLAAEITALAGAPPPAGAVDAAAAWRAAARDLVESLDRRTVLG